MRMNQLICDLKASDNLTYQMRRSNVISPKRSRRIEEFRLSSYIEESRWIIRPYLIGNLK